MNKRNYQLELEKLICEIQDGAAPKLLLQSCCGPCSTYVLEYLLRHFEVTVVYYNPNIYPVQEYQKRLYYQKKAISCTEGRNPVHFLDCSYEPDEFYEAVKGYEDQPEGGQRCIKCFRLRLEYTARLAKKLGFDYFGTTLTVSPHKNAEIINKIGLELQEEYGVRYLVSDFKKKNGYKRSIELSRQFELYRQEYCGCEFSLR